VRILGPIPCALGAENHHEKTIMGGMTFGHDLTITYHPLSLGEESTSG
jgi:hypothetical protein